MTKNVSNLCAYASFISGLNGRFGNYLKTNRRSIDDLTDISGRSNELAKAVLIIAMVFSGCEVFINLDELKGFYLDIISTKAGATYIAFGKMIFLMYFSVFIWRLMLYKQYKPAKTCTNEELMSCTVIVPAYNEGRQVLHTLRSVVRSDIPANKLQIIAVDDGSKDDTWHWIQKAVTQFPGRIQAIRLEKNCGKRKALHNGCMLSTGQVIVTIDSDSLIEPHTVRRLISPFSREQNVGAVAGCVRVLNLHQGIIPRMLDVAFAFSFDFYRASQSQVNSVFCTPGALSAYLRKPLMNNLDSWMNQTFMGKLSTIGEDRAMTNYILKDGYHVKFQSDAIVYTNVPVRYKQLCNMLLRWARSNIRETIFMASFIFKQFRNTSRIGSWVNFITSVADVAIPRLLITLAVLFAFARPDMIAVQLTIGALIATAVQGTFYCLRRKTGDAVWAFAYSLFAAFALSWIAPYAIVTAGNGKWLTREIIKTDTNKPADQKITIASATPAV
jgi:hyaluronan synthase